MGDFRLASIDLLQLGRDLGGLFQQVLQFFLQLLATTIHGLLLTRENDLASPPDPLHLPTNRRFLPLTFSKPCPSGQKLTCTRRFRISFFGLARMDGNDRLRHHNSTSDFCRIGDCHPYMLIAVSGYHFQWIYGILMPSGCREIRFRMSESKIRHRKKNASHGSRIAWRDGRVADCAALEMLCVRDGTGGSNPPLSASNPTRQRNSLAGFVLGDQRFAKF